MNFSTILTNWYSANKRELPWRNTKDPYKIWLSEIMLQQTQVKQGLPYYLKFVSKYPTVFELAQATELQILNDWQGLGYYSRARNLHETAKHVAFKLKGNFPSNYKGLLELKGVGDYTASAIASICYNESKAVVDGNVYRVLARYYGIDTPINSSAGIKEFKQLATLLLEEENPGDHNQAIMEFGAIQCKPKNPKCETCPFSNSCVALQKGSIQSLPNKLKSRKAKKRFFNYLIVQPKNGGVALEKRTKEGIWRNMYQFPLVESTHSINEEVLITLDDFKEIIPTDNFRLYLYNDKEIIHKLSHQHLYTKFWIVDVNEVNLDIVATRSIANYPTPVLISNFVNDYEFEN